MKFSVYFLKFIYDSTIDFIIIIYLKFFYFCVAFLLMKTLIQSNMIVTPYASEFVSYKRLLDEIIY